LAPLIVLFLFGACLLADQLGTRSAFYSGFVLGLLVYGPQLQFFHTIFHTGAFALWSILSLWLGLFVLMVRQLRLRFRKKFVILLIPVLWTGIEYFRSELYFLKFSWVNVGFAFSKGGYTSFVLYTGVYGLGYLCALVAAVCSQMKRRTYRWSIIIMVSLVGILLSKVFPGVDLKEAPSGRRVQVTGVQMEFPNLGVVMGRLNRIVEQYPETQLIVLSEYTFDGPVPEQVKEWCHNQKRYLIAGGKDSIDGCEDYYNTAFVVGPSGEVVFQQAKCTPIQFFKDGLPAPGQDIWESPWGKIGLAICYDLSYSRVIDRLVSLGAEALIIPTMDVSEWGADEHQLHSRIAPIRAAEYGIPIFRLCSSGISQVVDRQGIVRQSAPFPGQGEIIQGELKFDQPGRLPVDRFAAPLFSTVSLFLMVLVSLGRPAPLKVNS
jgi:apolipoprotein N-acyltransferase